MEPRLLRVKESCEEAAKGKGIATFAPYYDNNKCFEIKFDAGPRSLAQQLLEQLRSVLDCPDNAGLASIKAAIVEDYSVVVLLVDRESITEGLEYLLQAWGLHLGFIFVLATDRMYDLHERAQAYFKAGYENAAYIYLRLALDDALYDNSAQITHSVAYIEYYYLLGRQKSNKRWALDGAYLHTRGCHADKPEDMGANQYLTIKTIAYYSMVCNALLLNPETITNDLNEAMDVLYGLVRLPFVFDTTRLTLILDQPYPIWSHLAKICKEFNWFDMYEAFKVRAIKTAFGAQQLEACFL